MKADTAGGEAHAGADFEELSAQSFDLGGAPGQGQLPTKEVDQVVSGGVEEQAEGVGQKAVAAEAVGAEAVFEFFDAVLALAAIVVSVSTPAKYHLPTYRCNSESGPRSGQ